MESFDTCGGGAGDARHAVRYVPHATPEAEAGHAHGAYVQRCLPGPSLGPEPAVRTARTRLVRVARTYSAEG